jgi:hypothetical protein
MQIHAEPGCYGGGLIDLPCPRAADANLLQRDDVRATGRDDVRYALR